jgi:hypothetical protein
MGTQTMNTPRTPDEIDAAAAALVDPVPERKPLPAADVLDHYAHTISNLIGDLWALRESIDALPPGGRVAAIKNIGPVAAHLGDAVDLIERMARDLDIRLPPRR